MKSDYCRLGFKSLICVLLSVLVLSGARAQEKPAWEKLRAAYAYDVAKPLEAKTEPLEYPNILAYKVTLTGANGKSVPGLFARPKADGVFPVILLLHGLTSTKEVAGLMFGPTLIQNGFAVLALDAPHHGARKVDGENQAAPENVGDAIYEGCRDYRRALDWLATCKDVDMKHVGLIGYSMGSMMGSILGAVDSRINAVALCVGGDPVVAMMAALPDEQKSLAMAVSPSLYIAHIAPRPIYMLNGKQDETMKEPSVKLLYDAAGDPKKIEWFESGHILPKEALDKAITWITEKEKQPATAKTAAQ